MPDDSERRSLTASMRLALMPLVERYLDIKTTGLGAARQFLRSLGEVQKPRGRPPGKAYNDEPHLIEMGRLLEIGETKTRHGAAKIVVQSRQLGWEALDLFGVHPTAPTARFDCMGLVPLLRGRAVLALTDNSAAIKAASGGSLTFRRRAAMPAERCLVWERQGSP